MRPLLGRRARGVRLLVRSCSLPLFSHSLPLLYRLKERPTLGDCGTQVRILVLAEPGRLLFGVIKDGLEGVLPLLRGSLLFIAHASSFSILVTMAFSTVQYLSVSTAASRLSKSSSLIRMMTVAGIGHGKRSSCRKRRSRMSASGNITPPPPSHALGRDARGRADSNPSRPRSRGCTPHRAPFQQASFRWQTDALPGGRFAPLERMKCCRSVVRPRH